MKKNANTGKNESKVNSFFKPAEAPPPVDALADSSSTTAAAAAAEPTLTAGALTTAADAAMPPEGADAAAHAPSRKIQMFDGLHLKCDHSFKVTKCVCMDGDLVFDGMFTIMNEYGQIVQMKLPKHFPFL